jgi:starch synthase
MNHGRRQAGVNATIQAMLLVLHPTGNANVRQAVQAFAEAELLGEFHTCISWRPDGLLDRLTPSRLRKVLRRRGFPDCVLPLTRTHPFREGGRLLCQALHLHGPVAHERGIFSIDAVYQDLDRRVARRLGSRQQLTGVYGYEDGAAGTFTAARARGLRTIYDLPIGHWRAAQRLYEEERQREPQWASTLTGILDSPAKLQRKDIELAQAEAVVVASAFTRSTVEGELAPGKPIYVIPYGAPAVTTPERVVTPSGAPLRVLFAGALTQRKGLSYFLRACELAEGAVEATLIGRCQGGPCAPLDAALRRWRHVESVPHHEMLIEMSHHDVLVFPSLFEGFGLVILEAMAQGLPVISTTATGGPDVITDGVDGFIVPLREPEAIAARLLELHSDRELLRSMAVAARMKAASLTWSNYRARVVASVRAVLEGPGKAAYNAITAS